MDKIIRLKLLNAKKDERGNLLLTYETTRGEQVYTIREDGTLCRRIQRPLPSKLYDLSIPEAYQLCCFLRERGW